MERPLSKINGKRNPAYTKWYNAKYRKTKRGKDIRRRSRFKCEGGEKYADRIMDSIEHTALKFVDEPEDLY